MANTHKIQTVYIGDIISGIKRLHIPRNPRAAPKAPQVVAAELLWRHGFNAACSEIEIVVRELETFTVEMKDG